MSTSIRRPGHAQTGSQWRFDFFIAAVVLIPIFSDNSSEASRDGSDDCVQSSSIRALYSKTQTGRQRHARPA
jgi:hypothetical protein